MQDVADEIIKLIPQDQWDDVMNQQYCEIEPVFMGFTEIYKALSLLIPKHFTVIDLGCAYNPQCFYFSEHKKYISVDADSCKKFKTDNCDIYEMTIADFLEKHLHEYNIDETFMICCYVPPWYKHDIQQVAAKFKNMFTYYPCGGYDVVIKKPLT